MFEEVKRLLKENTPSLRAAVKPFYWLHRGLVSQSEFRWHAFQGIDFDNVLAAVDLLRQMYPDRYENQDPIQAELGCCLNDADWLAPPWSYSGLTEDGYTKSLQRHNQGLEAVIYYLMKRCSYVMKGGSLADHERSAAWRLLQDHRDDIVGTEALCRENRNIFRVRIKELEVRPAQVKVGWDLLRTRGLFNDRPSEFGFTASQDTFAFSPLNAPLSLSAPYLNIKVYLEPGLVDAVVQFVESAESEEYNLTRFEEIGAVMRRYQDN